MKIVITEEQYQEIIKERINKDTLKDLKINNNQSKEHLIKYAELISKIFLKNN